MTLANSSRVSNVRVSLISRGAALVLPAVISLIALAGVTVRPALDIAAARRRLERARALTTELDSERSTFERHARDRTREVAEDALARLRGLVPEECSRVVAHGVVRLAAEAAQVSLVRLDIGSDIDPGWTSLDERIELRRASLSGSARPAALADLLDELETLGFPARVLDVTLRRSARQTEFEFQLELGLLHFSPNAPPASNAQKDGRQP